MFDDDGAARRAKRRLFHFLPFEAGETNSETLIGKLGCLILSHARRMKIFSFRKIYALHFLSEGRRLRAIARHPIPAIGRSDLLRRPRSSLKTRSLGSRSASIRYRAPPGLTKNFIKLRLGFQREIPRRYFLFFMSSPVSFPREIRAILSKRNS